MPLPAPAPLWMSTACPARVSSSTPAGTIATRYSSDLISLGTPTIMARLASGNDGGIVGGNRAINQVEPRIAVVAPSGFEGILMRPLGGLAAAFLVIAVVVVPANGYIHFPPPTLAKMCQQSMAIRVLKVKKHDKEKGVIVYEAIETLKGKTPKGMTFKHAIGEKTKDKKPIFDWLGDGKQAVMFTIEAGNIACGFVFIDKFCYSVDYNRKGDFWLLIRVDPEMAATFHGTVETLRKVTADLLAGKEVKVPVDESVKLLSNEERHKRVPALSEIMKRNREK